MTRCNPFANIVCVKFRTPLTHTRTFITSLHFPRTQYPFFLPSNWYWNTQQQIAYGIEAFYPHKSEGLRGDLVMAILRARICQRGLGSLQWRLTWVQLGSSTREVHLDTQHCLGFLKGDKWSRRRRAFTHKHIVTPVYVISSVAAVRPTVLGSRSFSSKPTGVRSTNRRA